MTDMTIDSQDIPAGRTYEYRARLEQDNVGAVDSPRDYDGNAAILVLSHRRYDLPNEDDTGRLGEALEHGGLNLAARYLSTFHDAVVVPVWGYEHGALALSAGRRVGAFGDPWDSGLAGLAYCRRSWARKNLRAPSAGETLDDVIERAISVEVDQYSAWLQGDVFGWIAERRIIADDDQGDKDGWEQIESVWGYIGNDREYALGEAVSVCESRRTEDDGDDAEIDDLRAAELNSGAILGT